MQGLELRRARRTAILRAEDLPQTERTDSCRAA